MSLFYRQRDGRYKREKQLLWKTAEEEAAGVAADKEVNVDAALAAV